MRGNELLPDSLGLSGSRGQPLLARNEKPDPSDGGNAKHTPRDEPSEAGVESQAGFPFYLSLARALPVPGKIVFRFLIFKN